MSTHIHIHTNKYDDDDNNQGDLKTNVTLPLKLPGLRKEEETSWVCLRSHDLSYYPKIAAGDTV